MKNRYLGAGLLALVLLTGACGGSDPGQSPGVASADGSSAKDDGKDNKKPGGSDADFEKAALAFSRCMRANGIDMPDPGANGAMAFEAGQQQPDDAAMKKAEEACKAERQALEGSMPEPPADFQDKAVAMSRCMREQGIDMPDPTLSADGKAAVEIDVDQVEDPKFRQAQEECRKQTGMPEPGGAGTIGPGARP